MTNSAFKYEIDKIVAIIYGSGILLCLNRDLIEYKRWYLVNEILLVYKM